ncbi:MBOAT family O-acyltransferase [Marinicella litoralis]|uniref:Probable alginate O-acetylase n=1 Tax=Marinicella litoralis TaxID=644220 RepID=A0A4R6Y3U1_9GAMM|nr:MBOAT family O-acyltransferase [Marinicella litoralis]TDR23768.1 alginate O-acetyltransferase complex protein AlgI [Marinicella litoralis]
MLFNSLFFILIFLPLVVWGYWLVNKFNTEHAKLFLVFASLFFYAWWKVEYLALIFFSIGFNYWVSTFLHQRKSKQVLILGIVINLTLLFYFKYINFFIDVASHLGIIEPSVYAVALPLAISFVTFQQIAYIVDSYHGKIANYSFKSYVLFITFFPQLISGPIVHHAEMMPQFSQKHRLNYKWLAAGMTFFILGLFKKVAVADELSPFVIQVFDNDNIGLNVSMMDAWLAAVAYTLQLYFDFSGYSDMAIGLGLMFGIFLPLNFNSPLKSSSIIAFWRTWHMTLSRFLKDYLYIPMGGNRKGVVLKLVFLFITMVLGGLWHGAAYTFVLWGMLHGLYLIINHVFRYFLLHFPQYKTTVLQPYVKILAWPLTFIAVVLAFVVFRVQSVNDGFDLLQVMFGLSGPIQGAPSTLNTNASLGLFILVFGLIFVVKYFPNTQQILGYQHQQNDIKSAYWQANIFWLLGGICLLYYSLYKIMTNGYSEFIYRFF